MIEVLQQNTAQVGGQATCEALLGHACHSMYFVSVKWNVFLKVAFQSKGLYLAWTFLLASGQTFHQDQILHEVMIASVHHCSDVFNEVHAR